MRPGGCAWARRSGPPAAPRRPPDAPARCGLMRLHSVELQAFGPYATAQRIDFDRLARSGLFLLEGPTGAGETPIPDAITLALYGGLAGEDSGADRLHSDFAAPDVEPAVTVEVSLRGVRYRGSRG